MGTTAITPAAPSAPAPSAPATSTPTPAPVATPVTPTPSATATPPAGRPDPKDFRGDQYAELKQAQREWDATHPEGEKKPDAPAEGEQPAAEAVPEVTPETPAPEADKQPTPEELEAGALEDVEAPTPQVLAEMLGKNEALKAALEAHPEQRNALMKLAREHAEFAPIAKHFPDEKAAVYAKETAGNYVALQSALMSAVQNPETAGDAYKMFQSHFQVLDKDGNPVMEADGVTPKLGDDYYLIADRTIDTWINGSKQEIQARLDANQYATEEARERDQQRLLAYQFLEEDNREEGDEALDLSDIPESKRARIEQMQKELRDKEQALNGKSTEQQKQERAQAIQKHESTFRAKSGEKAKAVFDSTVDSVRKAGGYVPAYLLDSPDGKQLPPFVANVMQKFKSTVLTDPRTRADLMDLELLPPSDEKLQRRVDYVDKLYQRSLPRLIKEELRSINTKLKADLDAHGKKAESGNQTPEPRNGSAPSPRAWTVDSSIKEASRLVNEKFGNSIDQAEKNMRSQVAARFLRNGQPIPWDKF